MIETIEQAQAALRKHEQWCQRLVCTECDANADVVDLLTIVRRLLAHAHDHCDFDVGEATNEWLKEALALLARAPTNAVAEDITPSEKDP